MMFDALLVACCGYAFLRGGAPERIAGGSFIVAYLTTLASYSASTVRFYRVEQAVLATDFILLLVLVGLALRADRGWPMVVAGLQLDTVGAHLVRGMDLQVIRVAYALMLAIWSYPMLLVLAVGTFRHQRRLKEQGYDLAWTIPGGAKHADTCAKTATDFQHGSAG